MTKGRKPLVSKNFYINNKEFYDEIVKYKEGDDSYKEAIWLKFQKLAKRKSSQTKFSGYTYKEDFVSDAVVMCALKLDKFDHEKYTNPFAYFTEVVKNCFWANILYENRESEKKKMLLDVYEPESRGTEYPEQNKYGVEYIGETMILREDIAPQAPTLKVHDPNEFHGNGSKHNASPRYGF